MDDEYSAETWKRLNALAYQEAEKRERRKEERRPRSDRALTVSAFLPTGNGELVEVNELTARRLARILPSLRRKAERYPGGQRAKDYLYLDACYRALQNHPPDTTVEDVNGEALDLLLEEGTIAMR